MYSRVVLLFLKYKQILFIIFDSYVLRSKDFNCTHQNHDLLKWKIIFIRMLSLSEVDWQDWLPQWKLPMPEKVLLLDQETEQNIGGQAFWSFGGLFLINSPQQRRMGIKDSFELAKQDWMGTAGFDREEDYWPRQWAEAYLKFAAHDKYEYISKMGIKLMFMVGWAERGDGNASGHGNSVPRFHVSWEPALVL
jgi:hypothetical protein